MLRVSFMGGHSKIMVLTTLAVLSQPLAQSQEAMPSVGCPTLSDALELQNATLVTGNTEGPNRCYFFIDVPAGERELIIEEETETGIGRTLYASTSVNDDSAPCQRYSTGDAKCNLSDPASKRWWIAVYNADLSTRDAPIHSP
jgi:hypothetical protein